jgi:DNA-binding HxlR family transcriptional regulator
MSPRKCDSSDPDCAAIRRMLDRIGDKWSLYVVDTLREGPRRFNEIRRTIDGLSQRMLTLTLRGLERDGLVTRTVYPTKPPSVEYQLTSLGRTLLEPANALIEWVLKSRPAIEQAQKKYDKAQSADKV